MEGTMAGTLKDAVIVEAVRTPIGRGNPEKGIYRDVHPADLLGKVFTEVLGRAEVDSAEVDNVIGGCVLQLGEQSGGITRSAWLQEGLAQSAGATTVDVRCGSGQQAINYAAARIASGIDDVVVAGGVEHMGRVGFPVMTAVREQYGEPFTPKLYEQYALVSQGQGGELIAKDRGITRTEMDELSIRSHQRAAAATDEGLFAREIVPFQVNGTTHDRDQGIRPESSMEALGRIRSAYIEDGTITAGNASQVSDGAAAVLMMSGEKAAELGVKPRAKVIDQVLLGVDPITMLTGPLPATAKILKRNGMTIDDIHVTEINEAFAVVVLAWLQEHGADIDRVNPRGGAIALGHPLGASGARLVTTLLHELEDRDEEIGLVTMCCGGGIGIATLIQRV
jgi:acetyl-CoA acyltransferase